MKIGNSQIAPNGKLSYPKKSIKNSQPRVKRIEPVDNSFVDPDAPKQKTKESISVIV